MNYTTEEALLVQLIDILKSIKSNDHRDIDLGAGNYVPGKKFQLYVGVAGTVKGLNEQGLAVDRFMLAGYHPLTFSQITASGTTATSIVALY